MPEKIKPRKRTPEEIAQSQKEGQAFIQERERAATREQPEGSQVTPRTIERAAERVTPKSLQQREGEIREEEKRKIREENKRKEVRAEVTVEQFTEGEEALKPQLEELGKPIELPEEKKPQQQSALTALGVGQVPTILDLASGKIG